MKLQKEGYNPMGGCAPMLVTMLILFGMIDVIYKPLTHIAHMSKEAISSIKEIAKAAGANIQGLQGEINALQIFNGNPDLFNALDPDVIDKMSSINMNFLGLNLGEIPKLAFTPLIIIPILSLILSFASTMISTKITEKNNPEMNMGSMKIMMYIAPLFSIYLSFILPAGIGFYWIVNYIFGIAQQLLLYKMYNPIKLREQAEAKFKNKIQTTAMVEDIINESADNAENSAPKESLSQKEINRRRLALARKLDAEKYGEEYIEDKDTD